MDEDNLSEDSDHTTKPSEVDQGSRGEDESAATSDELLTTDDATNDNDSPHVWPWELTLDNNRDKFLEYLSNEGFRPSTNDDGHVELKVEGMDVTIEIEYTGAFRIVHCYNRWVLADYQNELYKAIAIVNVQRRLVSIGTENGTTIVISVEQFFDNHEDMLHSLSKKLEWLVSAKRALETKIDEFVEEMREKEWQKALDELAAELEAASNSESDVSDDESESNTTNDNNVNYEPHEDA
jgi:hypothetical protein